MYKPIHAWKRKDKLPSKDPQKIIYGEQLQDEFDAISGDLQSIEQDIEKIEAVGDAPKDGKKYGRQNGQWAAITEGSGSSGGGVSSWDDLTDKPTEFPPESHSHQQSEIEGLEDRLDAIEGSLGGESGGAANLGDLGDVTTAGAADGDQLTYDSVTGKWHPFQFVPFPSDMPSFAPGSETWTGEVTTISTVGWLAFKINGVDKGQGPAQIAQGATLALYWLGDPLSGEGLDSPNGDIIEGAVRTEDGASKAYALMIDKVSNFDPTDMLDVSANTVIASEVSTLTTANSFCYISGSSDSTGVFEYQKNTAAWKAIPSDPTATDWVTGGDDLKIRMTSADEGDVTNAQITVGETDSTWSITSIISGIVTPVIEAPENDATGISPNPVLIGSTYEAIGETPAHASTDWQVMDENGDVIYESLTNTSDLETHKVTQKLATDTVFKCRVRYRASDGRESEWSPIVSFRTTDLIPGQYTWNMTRNATWTVPAGCYSITLAMVGGGGDGSMGDTYARNCWSGGGGALQWINDYPVEPGERIDMNSSGLYMTFPDGTQWRTGWGNQDTPGSPYGLLDGGQTGGNGCREKSNSGGGGAAGYKGTGGAAGCYVGTSTNAGGNGSGGGGGGGGSSPYSTSLPDQGGGGAGGVVYLYGEGLSGAGGPKGYAAPYPATYGGAGSYDRRNHGGDRGGSAYGGGGWSAPNFDTGDQPNGIGSWGCVRFVWPGDESRGHFPNAVEDVK